MKWTNLKYQIRQRLKRWWQRTFAPPRYYVATYGDMGLEVSFYRSLDEFEEAEAEAEGLHLAAHIDTYTCGDIKP